MIPQLASPSVCVIDDEPDEYGPIMDALLGLGLGCVHVRGDTGTAIPVKPFKGLRLVFTDLHLTAAIGKAAASHTANIFTKVVSSNTAPVVVVIWSKYAHDPAQVLDLPPEDQPTEADQFKSELLAAEPAFKGRLLFVEMPKPKPQDRPEDGAWVDKLKQEIEEALKGFDAFKALWTWESMVHNAGLEVSATLMDIADSLLDTADAKNELATPQNQLKLLLKLLSQQQGGPDCAEGTAPRHLLTVLSHLGEDEIERSAGDGVLNAHGGWLAEKVTVELKKKCKTAKLNSILLTGTASPSFAAFSPGTVFNVTNREAFEQTAGFTIDRLLGDCCNKKEMPVEFKDNVTPIVLEVTAACDFHQGHRRSALLVGGIACPDAMLKQANSKDACKMTPVFEDRFTVPAGDWALVLCSRYRFTISDDAHPEWLTPRLRIRDPLMADIRNWYASQSARVGYLSF